MKRRTFLKVLGGAALVPLVPVVAALAAPPVIVVESVIGDIVWNRDPAVGQPMGWVCTVSGEPGTWKEMGKL